MIASHAAGFAHSQWSRAMAEWARKPVFSPLRAFGNQTVGVFGVALTFMALGLVLLGRVHDAR